MNVRLLRSFPADYQRVLLCSLFGLLRLLRPSFAGGQSGEGA